MSQHSLSPHTHAHAHHPKYGTVHTAPFTYTYISYLEMNIVGSKVKRGQHGVGSERIANQNSTRVTLHTRSYTDMTDRQTDAGEHTDNPHPCSNAPNHPLPPQLSVSPAHTHIYTHNHTQHNARTSSLLPRSSPVTDDVGTLSAAARLAAPRFRMRLVASPTVTISGLSV